MKTFTILLALAATTLAIPELNLGSVISLLDLDENAVKESHETPLPDPPLPEPGCTVRRVYEKTWDADSGSRWQYLIIIDGHPPQHIAHDPPFVDRIERDVRSSMGVPGCCALAENPETEKVDDSTIRIKFSEVVQPVGKTKAVCQSINILRDVAAGWGCEVADESDRNTEIKCA